MLYYIVEYSSRKMSYDVQKTDSLVSPFIGFIYSDMISKENGSCGNVKGYEKMVGWDNASAALSFADKKQCYKYVYGEGFVDSVRIKFAFQEGKWVFQSAIRTYNNKAEIALSATFGVETEVGRSVTERDGKAYNRGWLDLLEKQ